MSSDFIQKLRYSYSGKSDAHPLFSPVKDSLQLISDFFQNNKTNKLCLVFPSRAYAAQWLTIPTVLAQIESDFDQFKSKISESYKQYKSGDKLILNNDAVVEWVGIKNIEKNNRQIKVAVFKTKASKKSSAAEISIRFSQIIKLQPTNRKVLSSFAKVMSVLPKRNITLLEQLLSIDTFGNREFIMNNICLIGKLKSYDESIADVLLNNAAINDLFELKKIDESGTADSQSPFLVSNNLSNLALYVTLSNSVSKIIIDGFLTIKERGIDFLDIDAKSIPTILITDLSEIEHFEDIGKYGFEFYNLTRENLKLNPTVNLSPFHTLDKKLKNYISFNLIKEICQNSELESISHKIHSIEKDESNSDLTSLKINLIGITNHISRIAHILAVDEIQNLTSKINEIEAQFIRSKVWLGNSTKSIEESMLLLKSTIANLSSTPSEKCARLKVLVASNRYDYIICPTEEGAKELTRFIDTLNNHRPKVISVASVNDSLLSDKRLRVLLTGWAKSSNMNRILSSFLFSEITVLFYQFENRYFNSLQRRNSKLIENIKATVDVMGKRSEELAKVQGFDHLYFDNEVSAKITDITFDIFDFELKLDDAQYSKYRSKGSLVDSIKAKRIEFEEDQFMYSTETHKFLVINEFIERQNGKANLHKRKIDSMKTGDIIALINTDRDILVELVEKNTNTVELASVKQWTELWKNLLREYYASIGNDFRKLVDDLRRNDCKKHEVTIRTWLQDEGRIGPDDDADLISIALLTNSNLLNENIGTVRDAIRKMTGWRIKASDFITDKIKSQIHEFADHSIINKKVSIEGLGGITVLKVIEISTISENIDVKYVNRLLQKDTI